MPLSYPTTYIYTLSDPRTGVVRYVGKSNNPKSRYTRHMGEARDNQVCHRHFWIASLSAAGVKPTLSVIEECPREIWQEREVYWIAFYRAAGNDLVNRSDGGDGAAGCVTSEETRRKISIANTGKKDTPEARKRKSVALKGRVPHPDTYAAQGKHYIATSPEGKDIEVRNLSAFCRENGLVVTNFHKCINGKFPSHNGWRLRLHGQPLRELTGRRGGIPWTEERKKAFSEYQKLYTPLRGKKQSPEVIARVKATKLANPISLESRARISESRSKDYIFTTPEGVEIAARNLKNFCAERKLSVSSFRRVLDGKAAHHRGWKIRPA